jgi:hypothetical protein
MVLTSCNIIHCKMSDILCSFCSLKCKSASGLKIHLHSCKIKKNKDKHAHENASTSSNNEIIEHNRNSKEVKTTKKHIYFHKNVSSHKDLYPFIQDIEWDSFDLSEQFFIDCCQNKKHGIINLFEKLHKHPNYNNIQWSNNKLVIYDGKGWIEPTENNIITHMGILYSVLEEKWCDYLMNIRCGNIENDSLFSKTIIDDIDNFMYNEIVDDESVYFHCKDFLYDYLETIKEI